ncbi:MAG: transcriptional regulator [Thermoplasmatales archaeon]|nr:transcriptional regulator [Thermoplasmatales archaeon]
MSYNDLISGMLKEEGGFQKALRHIIEEELEMTVNEFCRLAGLSQSTMYKILEENREPNLRTVRQTAKAVRRLLEHTGSEFVAVIASHQVLRTLDKSITLDGRVVDIKEYPVATVEDAIVAAVHAERDGAIAVVCAPIVAPTVERILTIPVSPVMPTTSITKAVERIKDII